MGLNLHSGPFFCIAVFGVSYYNRLWITREEDDHEVWHHCQRQQRELPVCRE